MSEMNINYSEAIAMAKNMRRKFLRGKMLSPTEQALMILFKDYKLAEKDVRDMLRLQDKVVELLQGRIYFRDSR